MAFDQTTRNRLQRFVNDARKVQEEEFTRQLQNDYGLDPTSGTITPLENLRHLNDAQRETARILRDTLAHYCASQEADAQSGLERIVREQAFTVLNRLAALRMAEARGLLIESVGNGYQAKGFQLYARLAGTGLGETGDAYRVYLFSVFDELAQDLPGLFDRYSPHGRLFPREASLLQLLALINDAEIQPLWAEDETIGWIYQYFNSKEERKGMRDSSEVPRNSRELAVRNQFFTPRYVVEFLVDNTLGRLWFNATAGQTALRDRCQYLLVKPDEQPEAAVRLRDPQTLKLLDPACGSMHFGLYAFDLFFEIYREAWDWEQEHGPGSLDISTQPSAHFKPLSQTYADQPTFLREVPRLIIEHNIYGVDIDPRAAQIASLALWLRAQRAWHDADVKAKDRPQIGRGHVVAATAPPAERELRQQFVENLDKRDGELFEKTLQLLKGLPELGVLLQVERELPLLIRQVYVGKGTGLFAQQEQESWKKAEARLRQALTEFAQATKSSYQGRLFASDALQGLRMIDLCQEVFDVVVMNPPFGEAAQSTYAYIKTSYPDWANNILCCFISRAFQLLKPGGFIGAIFDRTITVKSSYEAHRRNSLIPYLSSFLDTGWGVLDANVETACACLASKEQHTALFMDVRQSEDKEGASRGAALSWRRGAINDADSHLKRLNPNTLNHLPNAVVGYDFDRFAIDLFDQQKTFEQVGMQARQGHALVSDIHFRLFWEVDERRCGKPNGHALLYNGSEYSLFVAPDRDIVIRGYDTDFLKSHPSCVLRNPGFQFSPGIGYGKRGEVLDAHLLEPEHIFTSEGQAIHLEDQNKALLGLAYLNSPVYQYLINLYCGQHKHAGYINLLPEVPLQDESTSTVIACVKEIIALKKKWLAFDETTIGYRLFLSTRLAESQIVELEFEAAKSEYLSDKERLHKLENTVNCILTDAAGLDVNEKKKLNAWSERARPIDPLWPGLDRENQVSLADSFLAASFVSEIVGFLYGRWAREGHSQSSTDQGTQSDLGPRFHPSVAFRGKDGLERTKEIFVDDASNSSDFEKCCGDLLASLYGKSAGAIEAAVVHRLQAQTLRSYFSASNGFFADHLKRYTKSRREAPIYWPLATTSGSYTLWVYYPNLSSQTLYTAINDFVEPKLKQVGDEVAALRNKGAARSRDDEKQFETLQAFELELIELRDTLLKIAQGYQPNHDDGVQITAAPLWPLFRHKPWQKILKDTWAKLEKGDYDWAHLAMSYWPERVREKCKTDKSLAIAHGLESIYVEPEAKPKNMRGKKIAQSI